MKFVKATLFAVASASASTTESWETIGLSSHMQLVSRALEMGGSRNAAKALLHSALETFEGSHSHQRVRMSQGNVDARSQTVAVPIDEKLAMTVKVSPTYALDTVQSVTLKAFRKIVGYDTFESIRVKERNETKDTSDYYNVTVSMMVQRKPVEGAAAAGGAAAASLASTLDKGFPYDD